MSNKFKIIVSIIITAVIGLAFIYFIFGNMLMPYYMNSKLEIHNGNTVANLPSSSTYGRIKIDGKETILLESYKDYCRFINKQVAKANANNCNWLIVDFNDGTGINVSLSDNRDNDFYVKIIDNCKIENNLKTIYVKDSYFNK